ncbi:MAG: hypothetical protein WAM14_16775 [Candidatus Nitrosopolaris sp.]
MVYKLDLKVKHQKYGKIRVINRKNGNQDSLDSRLEACNQASPGVLERGDLS